MYEVKFKKLKNCSRQPTPNIIIKIEDKRTYLLLVFLKDSFKITFISIYNVLK